MKKISTTGAQKIGKRLVLLTCWRGDVSPSETIAYRAACRAPFSSHF